MKQARIFQINVSDGGVPKLPVREAEVTSLGLIGDRQRHLEVHGGPDRALCLYSLERIVALQAEGHPIYPGAIGENLTLTGLDWEQMAPGLRLQLGADVLIELASYTDPCRLLVESFVGDEVGRVEQTLHPGWARLYARVLSPGRIRLGDPVRKLPEERTEGPR